MGKQHSDKPCSQKQAARDRITIYLAKNVNYQKSKLYNIINVHAPNYFGLATADKRIILSFIPAEHHNEFNTIHNIFEKSLADYQLILWYVNRLFTTADSISTVRKALPDYYHKYINIYFDGSGTIDQLYNENCFNILEQAPLNNLILGITNDS